MIQSGTAYSHEWFNDPIRNRTFISTIQSATHIHINDLISNRISYQWSNQQPHIHINDSISNCRLKDGQEVMPANPYSTKYQGGRQLSPRKTNGAFMSMFRSFVQAIIVQLCVRVLTDLHQFGTPRYLPWFGMQSYSAGWLQSYRERWPTCNGSYLCSMVYRWNQ